MSLQPYSWAFLVVFPVRCKWLTKAGSLNDHRAATSLSTGFFTGSPAICPAVPRSDAVGDEVRHQTRPAINLVRLCWGNSIAESGGIHHERRSQHGRPASDRPVQVRGGDTRGSAQRRPPGPGEVARRCVAARGDDACGAFDQGCGPGGRRRPRRERRPRHGGLFRRGTEGGPHPVASRHRRPAARRGPPWQDLGSHQGPQGRPGERVRWPGEIARRRAGGDARAWSQTRRGDRSQAITVISPSGGGGIRYETVAPPAGPRRRGSPAPRRSHSGDPGFDGRGGDPQAVSLGDREGLRLGPVRHAGDEGPRRARAGAPGGGPSPRRRPRSSAHPAVGRVRGDGNGAQS